MTGDCQPETETEPETEPGVRGTVLLGRTFVCSSATHRRLRSPHCPRCLFISSLFPPLLRCSRSVGGVAARLALVPTDIYCCYYGLTFEESLHHGFHTSHYIIHYGFSGMVTALLKKYRCQHCGTLWPMVSHVNMVFASRSCTPAPLHCRYLEPGQHYAMQLDNLLRALSRKVHSVSRSLWTVKEKGGITQYLCGVKNYKTVPNCFWTAT